MVCGDMNYLLHVDVYTIAGCKMDVRSAAQPNVLCPVSRQKGISATTHQAA